MEVSQIYGKVVYKYDATEDARIFVKKVTIGLSFSGTIAFILDMCLKSLCK